MMVGMANRTVGRYVLDENGKPLFIEKSFFGQGMIYKNWDAYFNHPDRVCYIPELSNNEYTRKSFLELADQQEELADELFDECDWQHPESLKEDLMCNEEWIKCKKCKRLFSAYDNKGQRTACPHCGCKYEY